MIWPPMFVLGLAAAGLGGLGYLSKWIAIPVAAAGAVAGGMMSGDR